MFELISIGDSTIDVFHELEDHEIDVICSLDTKRCQLCMTYADKIPVKNITKLAAGNAANNAVGTSRLGIKTALYTIIGDDDAGQMIRKKLEEEGVALDYVLTDRGKETNYSTVLSFHGERTILVYHVERDYALPVMEPATWMYLTSMAKGSEKLFDTVLAYIAHYNTKFVFQPGTFQLRLGADAVKELLAKTEIIIVNKEEATEYLGLTIAENPQPQKLIAGLLQLGPKTAVITDGQKGSYAGTADGTWFLTTRPEIPRIEATGAGDAYSTGFLVARMQNLPIPEAMRWGTFNAEGVIQQIGPQAGLLSRERMEFEANKYQAFQPTKL